MNLSRDSELSREAAAHFHHRAAVTYDAQLRESYIGLAMEYECLAAVLERIAMLGSASSYGTSRRDYPGRTDCDTIALKRRCSP